MEFIEDLDPYEALKLGSHQYTPEEIYRDCQELFSIKSPAKAADMPLWAWNRLPTQEEIVTYLETKKRILHKIKKQI